ncbi:hypothetical protein [uncultured Legionella sp.]|uniref:hypothetical protein n=1 Tax=uncultured Legionella sp. TaxID=210934 RepID=UPI0026325B93|nr:hypothetical protein [uncultured Legionella sp.]
MNFKDWCYQRFGILEFTEGKIINCVFIPALPQHVVTVSSAISKAGGRFIETSNARGIIIPYDNLLSMINSFKQAFYSFNLSKEVYPEWLNSYFLNLGLNPTLLYEYKDPSSIHLTFEGSETEESFAIQFNNFSPEYDNHPISGAETLMLATSGIIQHLFQLYYSDDSALINQVCNLSSMQIHMDSLLQLEQLISRPQRLNGAKYLAMDFSNTPINGICLEFTQAVSAYSLSLKVFAEVNRDNLAQIHYDNLNYTASLLAAYTPEGGLQQSLITDAKFISYLKLALIGPFLKANSKSLSYMDELPKEVKELIFSLISQNLNGVLYGAPCITLEKGASISMGRFLPGRPRPSDTDELIFQGGGRRGHSAIFRIIKVGILKNGSRALPNEIPHFYEYYKVEDNLGNGAHEIDEFNKTCTGTYVTKLEPHSIENNAYIKLDIDPYTDAAAYQHGMECTLKGLILVERQLLFHKPPLIRPENSEWARLNAIKEYLSGRIYLHPVSFYSKNPLDSSKIYQRTVCNQRRYVQEGGSCLIFSLKSLVATIIGNELCALHTNFMQVYNAQQYLEYIGGKIDLLQRSISRFSPVNAVQIEDTTGAAQVLASNKNTFFGALSKSLILEDNRCEQKIAAGY